MNEIRTLPLQYVQVSKWCVNCGSDAVTLVASITLQLTRLLFCLRLPANLTNITDSIIQNINKLVI